jgi:hypothetical protein
MPNWCQNTVTFRHTEHEQLRRLVKAYNKGALMEEFFPCPQPLRETVAGCVGAAGSPEQTALEIQSQNNVTVFGHENWCDWCVAEWGTKWDVGCGRHWDRVKLKRVATEVTLEFDSAWSPPIGFYQKMHDDLGFSITAYYMEGGVGFCGIWDDGQEHEYGLQGTAEEVKRRLPASLLETFNIIEQIAENEKDE